MRAADCLGRRNARDRVALGGFAVITAAGLCVAVASLPVGGRAPTADLPVGNRAKETLDVRALVTATAMTAGITAERIELRGHATHVVVRAAAFDRVVAWLAAIERRGGTIVAITIQRREPPGAVDVDMTVTP